MPNFQDPTSNIQLPRSNFQDPASNIQLPRYNFQDPSSQIQLPRPNFKDPASNIQLPRSNFQGPTSNFQLQRSSFQDQSLRLRQRAEIIDVRCSPRLRVTLNSNVWRAKSPPDIYLSGHSRAGFGSLRVWSVADNIVARYAQFSGTRQRAAAQTAGDRGSTGKDAWAPAYFFDLKGGKKEQKGENLFRQVEQPQFPATCALAEEDAKAQCAKYGFLPPLPPQHSRTCWKCGAPMEVKTFSGVEQVLRCSRTSCRL